MADEAQTIHRTESDRVLCGGSVVDKFVRPTLAEFLGTTFLVFLLCFCAPISHEYGKLYTYISSGQVYGFAYVFLIYALGDISGGYFNPAITFALTLNGALPVLVAVCFFIAQIVGGLLGAALALAAVPENKYIQFIGGATMLINDTKPGWAVLVESILTFILASTVLLTTLDKKKKKLSALAIGFSVIACTLSGAPYTGGSMNPARSLGPAVSYSRYLYFNVWEHHYVYWVGPTAGALVAAIVYRFLFAKRRTPEYMNFTNSEGQSTPSNSIPI
ncbi:aquaporin-8-like [Saccostrea echinata]|uniref:aquaporin-8-like n=1 Tax=Saccostrea echinata TaxID=191078 RepID=UPI002A813CAE|nr:aquaporin-8-like [Saccostrea echinata]